MIRFLIACDAFKGSLSAADACAAIAEGIRRVQPDADCRLRPLADGGEGTAETLLAGGEGEWIPHLATGPLPGMQVEAGFAWFPEQHCALVEMASASGLPLLTPDQRNPLLTSSYGTGELIAAAKAHGAKRILLAVGGSATVDGGTGAARALGWRFLDSSGQDVPEGGGALIDIARIVEPAADLTVPVEVLCDVTNPLLGPQGAAAIFGPQKGATPEQVDELERGLQHLSRLWQAHLDCDVTGLAGGGAAGGMAGGAVAFFAATLRPGIDAVLDAVGFATDAAWAECIITGEGSFDSQSLDGKVVSGVLDRARDSGHPVMVLAGRLGLEESTWREAGVAAALASSPPGLPIEQAMQQAHPLLANAAETLISTYYEI